MFDFKDFEVTALGRCAEPPLMEAALVSLWHGGTQECLASATVGPSSRVEGFYAWEPLLEPVVLQKGQEYRLSMHLGRLWLLNVVVGKGGPCYFCWRPGVFVRVMESVM